MANVLRVMAVAVLGLLVAAAPARAQSDPAPNPFLPDQNVFYGEVPVGGEKAPVIVYIHALGGVASDWWTNNDMYQLAYAAGYRTAFVSLNADNTRNNSLTIVNAQMIAKVMKRIAAAYRVPNVYVVAHSKGGVDMQAAMLQPDVSRYVKAVFTISSPHQGSELADWAFGPGAIIAAALGLLNPGVFSLQLGIMQSLRQMLDPMMPLTGVPFYTMSANTPAGNPLTVITGAILSNLTGGVRNDGFVPVDRTKLPATYAYDLGEIDTNHFAAFRGSLAFPRINAQIRAMEDARGWEKIADQGFTYDQFGRQIGGDRQNSFAWSFAWFRGALYVGTGRAFLCVVTVTGDVARGTKFYPPIIKNVECTEDPDDLPLSAEIWRFRPESHEWTKVYTSPQDIPIRWDANGVPVKFAARDIAFRGMVVYDENPKKPGQKSKQRLYVGGVSASGLFEKYSPYLESERGFPPPRMLWTDDGETWNEIPQEPGTFFGDMSIKANVGVVNRRGFRSMVQLRDANGVNHMFATLSDMRGVGVILESTDPSKGNNAWRQVSPPAEEFPVFTIYPYNGQIYCTWGERGFPVGYGIYRTDMSPDPNDPTKMQFFPVVTGQPWEYWRPDTAISMQEFQGYLYIGSDRPTELIRIAPDDSWDIVVGPPRLTVDGWKRPLSGLGKGFNSLFNGHFYAMGVYKNELHLGTWDWSNMLPQYEFYDRLLNHQYGFDFFKSRDGIHWNVITKTGFGDRFNSSVRNLETSPFGMFAAATNPSFGLQIYQDRSVLDLNRDGAIDINDVEIVRQANGTEVGPRDPRDLNEDGRITGVDAAKMRSQCDQPNCKPAKTPKPVEPPADLRATTQQLTPGGVVLSFKKVPGARRYHVYRSDMIDFAQIIPPDYELQYGGYTVTFQQIRDGALQALCEEENLADEEVCALVASVQDSLKMSGQFRWIGETTELGFRDTRLPATGQVLYYVRAEDASGRISDASNIAAGPSEAATSTFGLLQDVIRGIETRGGFSDAATAASFRRTLAGAESSARGRDLETAEAALDTLTKAIAAEHAAGRLTAHGAESLLRSTDDLARSLTLVRAGLLDAEPALATLLAAPEATPAPAGN